tara:strand:- start:737 stop:1969 length:1233 start_codon:yes stop_codon:yes gene_type:complete
MSINYSHSIIKTLGFFSVKDTRLFADSVKSKGFVTYKDSEETIAFLNKSYHSEYIKLMFNNNPENFGVEKLHKELKMNIIISRLNLNVAVSNIRLYLFNDAFKDEQTCIFAVDYSLDSSSLTDFSNALNSLKNPDSLITLEGKEISIGDLIEKHVLYKSFINDDSPVGQYAGYKFKHYAILDFDKEELGRENLLFELGTDSKIGSISEKDIDSPSEVYKAKVLENKISCFNNYDCLTLLDSFTVVGSKNYDSSNSYNHNSWDNIYFSLYVFNLYVKASLQTISNEFSDDSVKKRKEFKSFYNKYFFIKVSFNFLPNEIYKGIFNALEIEEDLEFIQDRLETLAVQMNEKQQKQIGLILLVISVIALLETPLHIEGIRKIIGIDALVIYNSTVYFLLVFSVIVFLYKNLKK